jgi:hypothetical protein
MIGWVLGSLAVGTIGYMIFQSSKPIITITNQSIPIGLNTSTASNTQQGIIESVKKGNFDIQWSEITSTIPGYVATFRVFSDALKIEGIRVNVTASTNQEIADILDCVMLTPKIADLIWKQRITTLPPFSGPPFDMSSYKSTVWHSEMINKALAHKPKPWGLICTVGKLWVLSNDLVDSHGPILKQDSPIAMNYGWHFIGTGYEPMATKGIEGRVIQGKGTAHNSNHTDYSQVCVLMHNTCMVNGKRMNVRDVWSNPDLANLANDGILKVTRQPTNAGLIA